MKRLTIALSVLSLVAVLAGCGATAPTPTSATCQAKENALVLCQNGKEIDFSAEKTKPHKHEAFYAPVVPLAKALGVTVDAKVSADGKTGTLSISGKEFKPTSTATDFKGLHVHEGALFVPLKEFAAAAGLTLKIDDAKQTVNFTK
jgi:hypothetical protein